MPRLNGMQGLCNSDKVLLRTLNSVPGWTTQDVAKCRFYAEKKNRRATGSDVRSKTKFKDCNRPQDLPPVLFVVLLALSPQSAASKMTMYMSEKPELAVRRPLRERFLHQISRLRYRTCALTGLILILISTFWLYGNSGPNGLRFPFSADMFSVEHTTWIDNSTRSDWVKPRPGHIIPPKIWQIMLPKNWKDKYPVNNPDKLKETASWLAMNTDYAYTLVGGKGGKEFVQRRFGNHSKILQTYNNMPNVGMKSDMLRYLLLDVEGGVYTDTDTLALKPVDTWVPRNMRNATRLIVGIEFDQRDGPAWADIPHPLQFCQWTIAAAPGHPVFKKMTNRVVESVEDLVRQHGVKENQLKPTSFEVMNSTGPAAWTDVVFEHLQTIEPSLTDIRNLSYMTKPTLYGDVLVLPIDGFGMGQLHSDSTHDGTIPDDAFVQHLFGGSWRDQ
ncbi:hypothetical protein K4K59_008556 [Colletotrichum sp. SAR11_240]|nr:hypothetical protein K4K59_008556 [Colletotrichum sp. SAR11_240]